MPLFVVHEHHARRLHWDLRLEMRGALKSWAVPKQPPKKAGIRRLAIGVEDHPLSYADFEGTIPEGQYGAGAVKIWDSGSFELTEDEPGKLVFVLKGKKLSGTYCLIRTKLGWLFFRKPGSSAGKKGAKERKGGQPKPASMPSARKKSQMARQRRNPINNLT